MSLRISSTRKVPRGKPTRKEPTNRLVLEALESRDLLSACTVDRLTDNGPQDQGEGSDGMGDLRWCVIRSIFQPDTTIGFAITGTINLAAALPNLTNGVRLEGPGADLLTVRRDMGDYRIFTVATRGMASLAGLTITNGDDSGILNLGTLTISDTVVSGNSAATHCGGGIYNFQGTLTVNDSTISGNTVAGGVSTGGGGICNFSAGPVIISNSTISGNTVTGGLSAGGGGIWNGGTLTVDNSTISGNSAGDFGGGIYNGGTLMVSASTISENTASSGSAPGGGIDNQGMATVSRSTLSGNSADSGGAIFNSSQAGITISDSTIVGNSAHGKGGGIFNFSGNLTLSNSTIASNRAASGGGVSIDGALIGRNTIIAGNGASSGPDVQGHFGSHGYNLIGNPLDSSGWVDTDRLSVSPALGPLQDNGGPTLTMALLPGSSALNTGAPDQLGVPDQRGVIRSGHVNTGAYQASASAFIVAAPAKVTAGVPFDITVIAVDPFGQVALGYTGTVTFSATDPGPGAVLPADYTFTAGERGRHTFTDTGSGETTLVTRGQQAIRVTDTTDDSITGSATLKVRHMRRHDDEPPGLPAGRKAAAADWFFVSIAEEKLVV